MRWAAVSLILSLGAAQAGVFAPDADVLSTSTVADVLRAVSPTSELGRVLFEAVRPRRAGQRLEDVEAALRLKPGDGPLLARRAELLLGMGRLDEAAESAWRAARARPDDPDFLEGFGFALLACDSHTQGALIYERLKAGQPDSPLAAFNLGAAAYGQGRYAEAETWTRTFLKAKSNHPRGLFNLAVALFAQDRAREAEAVLRTLLNNEQNHLPALALLHRLRAARGDTDGAAKVRARMQELQPEPQVDALLGQPVAGVYLLRGEAAGFQSAGGATTAWLDRLWHDHLLARATRFTLPVAREAFRRDALRVDAASTGAVWALLEEYRANGEPALAGMAACYGRAMHEGDPAWEAVWAAESNTVCSLPAAPGDEAARAAYDAEIARFTEALTSTNLLQAELVLRGLLRLYPRAGQLLINYGAVAVLADEWPRMAMVHAYFRALHPANFDVANNLAAVLDRLGRPGAAADALVPFLDKNPGDLYLLSNLTRLTFQAGRVGQADALAAQWREAAALDAEAWLWSSEIKWKLGDVEGAKRYVDMAAVLAPGSPLLASLRSRIEQKVAKEAK